MLVGILLRPLLAALDIRDANVDLDPWSFSMSDEHDRNGGEGGDVGACVRILVVGLSTRFDPPVVKKDVNPPFFWNHDLLRGFEVSAMLVYVYVNKENES